MTRPCANSAPDRASDDARAAPGHLRLRLTLAFDGTAHHGWHSGRSGRGVCDQVEAALAGLFPSRPSLVSSSRTDSGVHALGLVAHFDVPASGMTVPVHRLAPAINATLPDDIRVLAASRARPGFHARFSAASKQYRYRFWNHPVMNPLLRQQAWHLPRTIDREAMREAARRLCGHHDFRAFTTRRDGTLADAHRTLTRCNLQFRGPEITLILESSGFLFRMCRSIAGSLAAVATGRLDVAAIDTMLTDGIRPAEAVTAPAHGLTLWRVGYGTRR